MTRASAEPGCEQYAGRAGAALALPADVEAHALCLNTEDTEALSKSLSQARRRTLKLTLDEIEPRFQEQAALTFKLDPASKQDFFAVVNDQAALSSKAQQRLATQPQASSGNTGDVAGFIMKVCSTGFKDIKGHAELTRSALETVEPSWSKKPVLTFMADASQDADFYQWRFPAAHAQTPNVPVDKATPGDSTAAFNSFLVWIRTYLAKSAAACEAGNIQESAYYAGFVLHALQDAATHQGRTNAEHSYNAKTSKNPDWEDIYLNKAEVLTEHALRAMRNRVLSKCWARFGTEIRVSKMPQSWKKEQLGKWDLSPEELSKYSGLAKVYADAGAGSALEVRWFTYDDDWQQKFSEILFSTGLSMATPTDGGVPSPDGGVPAQGQQP